MDAKKLYRQIDKDFELNRCRDDWSKMDFNEFISENFKKRYMGLVLDNSEKIDRVYAAVFPTDAVLNKIIERGKQDALLLTHHPMIWDITKAPVFTDMNIKLLKKLREKNISMCTLHVPLDKNGKYSTSVNLAKALGIAITGEFFEYYGVRAGVFGKTNLKTVGELADRFALAAGHKTKICSYGDNKIKHGRVAVVAGGGVRADALPEIIDSKINTLVTGIAAVTNYSKPAHRIAKQARINVIGGTHYSSEKFGCIAICDYFKKLGLPCEFIEDTPSFADIA